MIGARRHLVVKCEFSTGTFQLIRGGHRRLWNPNAPTSGNGETYHFDFVTMSVGDARCDVRTGNGIGVTLGDGLLLTSMPILVLP